MPELTCPKCGATGGVTECQWIQFECGSEGTLECDGAYYVTEQSAVCELGQITKRAVATATKAANARIAELEEALEKLFLYAVEAESILLNSLEAEEFHAAGRIVIADAKAALEGGAS